MEAKRIFDSGFWIWRTYITLYGTIKQSCKELSWFYYEEHHKGEKVRIYRETTVMTNEEKSMTSKCLLLQSGQNQYSEEAKQHLLQKYSSETVMAMSKVNSLSSFIDKLCLGSKLWNFKVQKVVKFHVYISPIFSYRITYILLLSLLLDSKTANEMCGNGLIGMWRITANWCPQQSVEF